MPPWLTELLRVAGFTAPFVYAAATYGVFHWLDKKASGAAKRSLSVWLAAPPQTAIPANFGVEVFDRVYSRPLLSIPAFLRSLLITSLLTCLVWLHVGLLKPLSHPVNYGWGLYVLGSGLVFNICSDYISLFFIRKWLATAGRRPIIGLLVGCVIGLLIIYASYLLRFTIFVLIGMIVDFGAEGLFSDMSEFIDLLVMPLTPGTVAQRLIIPAIAIHLWLPLLAASVVIVRGLNWLFKMAVWAQWFIKQGQHHPFQAVGYVAALIVFALGVVIQALTR